jgi:hypothetical protein
MAEKKALHSITTEVERDFVEIDGEAYTLRTLDEFSLGQAHLISRWGKKLVHFFSDESTEVLSEEEYAEMQKRLKEVTASILMAPPELIEKIPDFQKMRLLDAVFSKAPKAAPEENSENLSQSSNASMEEIPSGG